MLDRLPTISVITPSFNQGQFLEETIQSVLNQQYPKLEYIIVDGGSTDNSVEIIPKHERHLAWWVSEKDGGQADAINKGIAHTTGEVIGFMNSDDTYVPGALAAAASYFANYPQARWVCGHGLMFGECGRSSKFFKVRVPHHVTEALFNNLLALSPSTFWRREVFEEHGYFATQYHYFFDIEFYIRLMLAGEKCLPLDYPVSAYRLHEESKTVAQAEKFTQELAIIRETYLPQVPAWRVRREYAREQWRQAEEQLYQAITKWRSGQQQQGLQLGLDTLRHSPIGAFLGGYKWARRNTLNKLGLHRHSA